MDVTNLCSPFLLLIYFNTFTTLTGEIELLVYFTAKDLCTSIELDTPNMSVLNYLFYLTQKQYTIIDNII